MPIPIKKQRITAGTVIGNRFTVLDVIGSGAVGTVVYASDDSLDRELVALKILHPHLALDRNAFSRFQNEVLIARQLSHPHIIRVFDFDEAAEQNLFFISMELIRGPNLKQYLDVHKGRRLELSDAVRVLYHLALALSFAHERGIIHRDVKPENILLTTEGDAKLGDFGLASSLQTSLGLTRTGEALGTAQYMSPEQLHADNLDGRTDIYALGIIAYEMTTGRAPFSADGYYALAQQHFSASLPTQSLIDARLPQWFIDLVVCCTAKDRNERFADCREFIEQLKTHAFDSITTTSPKRIRFRGVHQSYFKTRFRVIFGIFLVLGLVGCYYGILQDPNSRSRLLYNILRVEQAYQRDLAPLRQFFRLGSWSVLDDNSVLRAVATKDERTLSALVKAGAFLDAKDAEGNTAIHKAAMVGSFGVVTLLCSSGEDLNLRNNAGDLPVHTAIKTRNRLALETILKYGADPHINDAQGNNLMHLAAQLRFPAAVRTLAFSRIPLKLWLRNAAGHTPLHIAVRRAHIQTVRALLKLGADPNVRDSEQRTPLMVAFLSDAPPEIVKLLLTYGAEPAFRDGSGASAAEYAARVGRTDEMNDSATAHQ